MRLVLPQLIVTSESSYPRCLFLGVSRLDTFWLENTDSVSQMPIAPASRSRTTRFPLLSVISTKLPSHQIPSSKETPPSYFTTETALTTHLYVPPLHFVKVLRWQKTANVQQTRCITDADAYSSTELGRRSPACKERWFGSYITTFPGWRRPVLDSSSVSMHFPTRGSSNNHHDYQDSTGNPHKYCMTSKRFRMDEVC